MNTRYKYILFGLLFCFACQHQKPKLTPYEAEHITHIETGKTMPDSLVNFACSLAGTPYKYGSTDPKEGFDCSGFVTYVFNHFGIMVPRTSVDFTPVQHPIPLRQAKLGDLILFTGTDSTSRVVGHMGIISSTSGEPLRFMHATSGKNRGVVETDFHTPYYEARYIKTIRIFRDGTSRRKHNGSQKITSVRVHFAPTHAIIIALTPGNQQIDFLQVSKNAKTEKSY